MSGEGEPKIRPGSGPVSVAFFVVCFLFGYRNGVIPSRNGGTGLSKQRGVRIVIIAIAIAIAIAGLICDD